MWRFVEDDGGHLALFTMVTNRHSIHVQVCMHTFTHMQTHTHTHSQGGRQNQDLCVLPESPLLSHPMEGKYLDQVSHAVSVLTG